MARSPKRDVSQPICSRHVCVHIYTRGAWGSPMEKRWGGVGWGGVGHVTVMFMLRWCYVDGRGGVGWGMLPSCSCYVDATLMGGVGWGGVGWGGACYRHVHVTLMLRWWEGWGGVGWGMLPSCSCYVDATLMGGVGWGGVGHVTVMFMLRWCYVDGRGGVGWGMLPSCSCYVDATLMLCGKSEKNVSPLLRACCVLLTKHSVFTVYYIEWKHKNRLTVSTCNFLHIANSLQITVQK